MTDEQIIAHYGIKRRSGRYPWGSGGELLNAIDTLSKEGLSESEIAAALNISTTELREQKTLAKAAAKEYQRLQAVRLKESGMSNVAIGAEMGVAESSVREMLKPSYNAKHAIIQQVATVLKDAVERYGYIDVGEAVELYLGVSETKLKSAIALLRNEGYTLHYLREPQLGTGKDTSYKVLAKPDTTFQEVYKNKEHIRIPNYASNDYGETFIDTSVVNNISSSRVFVRYNKEGGENADGLIELRKGVDDLTLGGKSYAQVRIGIDGTHYLKGMAVYSDKIPDGYDIVFNTSKDPKDNKLDAFKMQSTDIPERPFGATTRPNFYEVDGEKRLSAINIVNEEGDWGSWGRNLSSQFLSKQSPVIAKRQLEIDYDNRRAEFEEIMSLTNPTVRQHMLNEFSNSLDAAAVHLKAAALPRQTTAVILPSTSIKPTEVYAPNYNNGEKVVLIRYPHGGIFEIPTVTVNNRNKEAKSLLGSATDAIVIHPDIAKRLSGADFDGDFVIVAPNDRGHIKTSPALEGLKDFDPVRSYPPIPGMKPMTGSQKQLKMGDVSNLITDMTVKGASTAEIARAVRHSMVVIDSEKHELNWRKSYEDNGIAALKTKYQSGPTSGASTLISRASSQQRVPHRSDTFHIDPSTGEKVYVESHKTFIDKNGVETLRTSKSTKMYEVKDARKLSSGTVIENVYAEHANKLKDLANTARKNLVAIKPKPHSSSAAKTYAKEVASLEAKLKLASRNKPLERKAQILANVIYKAKVNSSPTKLSAAQKKKEKGRALVVARARIGAKKPLIEITPREWEAIQMGAISPTRLAAILRNTDMDRVRALATPKSTPSLSAGQANRARNLLANGYTAAEVSLALGVPRHLINATELTN